MKVSNFIIFSLFIFQGILFYFGAFALELELYLNSSKPNPIVKISVIFRTSPNNRTVITLPGNDIEEVDRLVVLMAGGIQNFAQALVASLISGPMNVFVAHDLLSRYLKIIFVDKKLPSYHISEGYCSSDVFSFDQLFDYFAKEFYFINLLIKSCENKMNSANSNRPAPNCTSLYEKSEQLSSLYFTLFHNIIYITDKTFDADFEARGNEYDQILDKMLNNATYTSIFNVTGRKFKDIVIKNSTDGIFLDLRISLPLSKKAIPKGQNLNKTDENGSFDFVGSWYSSKKNESNPQFVDISPFKITHLVIWTRHCIAKLFTVVENLLAIPFPKNS